MSKVLTGLSVVIVTYNAPEQLRACLRYLRRSLWATDEVIVVDDGGSVSGVDRIVEEVLQGQPASWRYHYHGPTTTQFRLAAARNIGLRYASRSRVLCLDGDCLPDASMLSYHRHITPFVLLCGLREHIKTPVAEINALPVQDSFSTLGAREPDERYRLKGGVYQRSYELLKANKYGSVHYRACWGFQMSFPLHTACAIGGFNEEFETYGGEDQEFAGRMQQTGLLLDIDPRAICYHLAHPRRSGDWQRQVAESLERKSPMRNGGPLHLINVNQE